MTTRNMIRTVKEIIKRITKNPTKRTEKKPTKGVTKGLTKGLTDIMYPPVCALCGSILTINEVYVCVECRPKISYVTSPVCLRCGKEICDEDDEYCADCTSYPKSYVRGFPAINYEEPVKSGVAAFKYANRRKSAEYFAYEIVKQHGKEILEVRPDVLVPVPIHRSKMRKRGYNQAELMAKELGVRLGIPVDSSVLCRVSDTMPQKRLDPKEREKNLRSALVATIEDMNYNNVMLVDDIYTTGATVEACTATLHKKGIKNVYYTSICIGKGY